MKGRGIKLKREFIYTDIFERKIKNFKLNSLDLINLEKEILADPKIGEVIQNTGGLRKFRFSPFDLKSGKSGAYRIFYLDLEEIHITMLITIIKKNEDVNISQKEKAQLKKLVNDLKKYYK